MSASDVPCQSSKCPNGKPPSRLECPTCNKFVGAETERIVSLIECALGLDWVFAARTSVVRNASRPTVRAKRYALGALAEWEDVSAYGTCRGAQQ
jgi:hypothetical protein